MASLRAIAAPLEVRLELVPRWRGPDLHRLLDSRHAALGSAVVRELRRLGWDCSPEVSFSVYGERGAIDILAWHGSTGTLLVVELKTVVVDLQELLGGVDRKIRLARRLGRERGWKALSVGGWVVVAEGRTSRRRLGQHRPLVRAAFPVDGRGMRRWLRDPVGGVRALSFWPSLH